MALQNIPVGNEQTPVIVIDDFVQTPDDLVDMAAQLAPFPSAEGNFYPGVRRVITPDDALAFRYVEAICRSVTPLIGSVYGAKGVELVEASFSLVTTPPEKLQPKQSKPHVDAQDRGYFAVLHYLGRRPGGGTAFYRHDRTGFETLLPERVQAYSAAEERNGMIFGPPSGYHAGDSNGFSEVAAVEARFNRAAIYPGNLLHSGRLPDNFDFDPDPRTGRLTANFLLRATG